MTFAVNAGRIVVKRRTKSIPSASSRRRNQRSGVRIRSGAIAGAPHVPECRHRRREIRRTTGGLQFAVSLPISHGAHPGRRCDEGEKGVRRDKGRNTPACTKRLTCLSWPAPPSPRFQWRPSCSTRSPCRRPWPCLSYPCWSQTSRSLSRSSRRSGRLRHSPSRCR